MNIELKDFMAKNKDKQLTLSLNLKLDVKPDDLVDDAEDLTVVTRNKNCSSSRVSKNHDEMLNTHYGTFEATNPEPTTLASTSFDRPFGLDFSYFLLALCV